jgi:predicted AAA+ superfamily ATPase
MNMDSDKYIKRDIEGLVLSLSEEYSCILVSGPRQVGKSTMLKHIMKSDRNVVTLDDLNERALAKTDPEMFLAIHPAPVLIDEVQYAPELFPYIKMRIDNGAPAGSYWLTGSQAFKLMKLAQESLAGRVALLHLSSISQNEFYGSGENRPFSVSVEEIAKRSRERIPTDVNGMFERVFKGTMPGHISGKFTNRDVFYSSYLQTYLERDVSEMIDGVDKVRFLDFIRAAACRVGQQLNVHAIASDVGIADDTASRWLEVLEKSDIIFYLRPYSNNLLKRTVKIPKIYFFDTGLVAYLTRYSSPEILANGSINGAILENYIVSEIRKTYLNAGMECYLHYYRDKDTKEIDLIIESDGVLHPLEIKKAATATLSMVSSFSVLTKSSVPTGIGGVLCLKESFTALNKDVLVIPAWTI